MEGLLGVVFERYIASILDSLLSATECLLGLSQVIHKEYTLEREKRERGREHEIFWSRGPHSGYNLLGLSYHPPYMK